MTFFKTNILLIIIGLFNFSCQSTDNNTSKDNSLANRTMEFTGSESCKSCHEQEYALWKNSHHDLAMQIADSSMVLGNFNNISFSNKEVNYRFFKNGNDFYVNTEGENGEYEDYKIAYTFGVYPLQQYLIEFPGGKYQCLLAAWDSKDNKWFALQPDLTIHHDEWMHWTGGSMTWNNMCADCHSTNLHKNFDTITDTYHTTYSIINVSCEACHGPSSEHIAFYENREEYEGQKPPELYMGKVVAPKEIVQKCARCHSRRSQLTDYFDYEGHFLDHYNPSLIVDPVYQLDGQINDEDYVYGSFVQSKMYRNGVSCKDCHDMHSLKLKKEGNNLCLSCHEPKYNEYEHHFHKANTEASLCINCHMPGKYYMGNDFRRDHSFRVPRPDQTVIYNTPNACNGCHTDKSAQWVSNFINEKYGDKRPEHFSDNLLAGYHGNTDAFYRVFSQYNYPEIIRATALEAYTNTQLSSEQINVMLRFVNDSSALVRSQTILALDKLNQYDFSENIKPLLTDSIRWVRINAARYLSMRNISIDENQSFKKAHHEYLDMLKVNADFASGQHQIALFEQAKGNTDAAINAYKKAIKIDNYYNMSRLNLALLEYTRGNSNEAEKLYSKVIEQEPDYSYPYFMLGLLYNEKGNTDESLKYLELATQKQPVIERAFYNYALKLQEKELFEKSIIVTNKILETNHLNEEFLYVRLIGELNTNKKNDALITCKKLLEINPQNTNYKLIQAKLQ